MNFTDVIENCFDYICVSTVSIAFLILLWCGFYWLATNSYVELVFLLLTSLIVILSGSTLAYAWEIHHCSWAASTPEQKRRTTRALLIHALIFIIVFVVGCFLLSGSPSFAEFINKYFVDVIAKRQF